MSELLTPAGTPPAVAPPRPPAGPAPAPSALRAWLALVSLSFQRQARARQMVWIALTLLTFTATVVALNTAGNRWGMDHWRHPRRTGPTFREFADTLQNVPRLLPGPTPGTALQTALAGATREVLDHSDFFVFSSWVVFSVFLSFLLPIWSLSFATESLGGEREAGSLIWTLTRPIPRPAVYLAKFVAQLPWSLSLNVGGFAVLCLAAGRPGLMAFRLYWPAVLWGSLAFCALFHLLGACFRRAAVLALVYSFFLETILGNMPGHMKRVSISFYTRCMMFEQAQEFGIQPQKPSVYLPVDGTTAWLVLMGATVVLLAAGMVVFARTEYQDLT